MRALRFASLQLEPDAAVANAERSVGMCLAPLALVGRAPARELFLRFRRRRINAEDALARHHLLLHEILERCLLEGLIGNVVGDLGWNNDDTFGVADDDIARI